MGKKERIISLNICVFWISLDYLRVCLLWKINAINLRFTTTKKVIYFSDRNEGEELTPYSNWICTLYIYLMLWIFCLPISISSYSQGFGSMWMRFLTIWKVCGAFQNATDAIYLPCYEKTSSWCYIYQRKRVV